MSQLSPLELAVGIALARQICPTDALVRQLATATVWDRTFTGVGFYTRFRVDKTLPPVAIAASPGGWVTSDVGPDAYPLQFMLYVRDGYAELIEAFSFGEGYGDSDLLIATFTPPREVAPGIVVGG